MSRTYAILWAKLMQARLNESKNVAIADVAKETLNRMGITIPKERTGESDPLVTDMIFELGSEFVFDWEHSEALGKWFNERHRPNHESQTASKISDQNPVGARFVCRVVLLQRHFTSDFLG